MHRISTKTAPAVLHARFQRPCHSYPTNFSKFNHSLATCPQPKKANLENQ